MVMAQRVQRLVVRAATRPIGRRSMATRENLATSASASAPSSTPPISPRVPKRRSYGIVDSWLANQRAYNAAHYPSTPCPAVYRYIYGVTESVVEVFYLLGFLGFGAFITSGLWAPWAINYQRRKAEERFAPLKGEIN